MRRFASAALALVAVATAASACSGNVQPTGSLQDRNREYFADLGNEARERGADAAQVAVLEEAAVSGSVTDDQVLSLYEPFFSCLDAVGAHGEIYGRVELAPGMSVPDYRVGIATDPTADATQQLEVADHLIQECTRQYVGFVWQALYLQPVAVDARNQALLNARGEIAECLEPLGTFLRGDEDAAELATAIVEAEAATGIRCFDVS